jgi:galactose mutarotase-like enzyme
MLSIENEFLKISVQKTGAELCSVVDKSTNQQYMWCGDTAVWGSFGPVLFPIIGCLKDNEFLIEDKSYSVPKHGFIRNNSNLESKILNENTIEFRYKYNENTLKNYPYLFEFELQFVLVGKTIHIEHTIINHHEEKPMYFSLGGHPGFKCPFFEGEKYEDYYIEFEQIENDSTCKVTPDGLIDVNTVPCLENTNRLQLHPLIFENDALIFKNLKSKKVTLKTDAHTFGVEISFSDFNYLGIWAKPNAPFVCIEPWLGISDSVNTNKDFTQKEGIQLLEAGNQTKFTYSIRLLV